jgi:hypothetical protein
MTKPVFSPDGKFMWTGSEWIPAPPSSGQSAKISVQDSVVSGDVNITQNKTIINESKARKSCLNCGAIGSILIACSGSSKKRPNCRDIDYCDFCEERLWTKRLRKIGKLGDRHADGMYRNWRTCHTCWKFQEDIWLS